MITQLTPENFESETKEDIVFVKFSTKKGCRFCDEFQPIYELSSNQANPMKYCEYVRESLPTIDNDLDEIEKKYKIGSFPTVLLFENGENKGNVPKYKFYSDRVLTGMILDEQKKLYNQQCFVEDLQIEMNLRKQVPNPVPPAEEPDFLPQVPPAPHEEGCTE